jgi:hypothetical protein
VQEFISSKLSCPLSQLALQKNPFPDIEWLELLKQIESKVKAKDKLPKWFSTKNILYPSKISIEQTSSEKTAQYKSTLVNGNTLIDLTGGFGVDDYYFSKKITTVAHCEINAELSAIVKHNFEQLNCVNIQCCEGDSTEILKNSEERWDWIYIDPSRRSDTKGKVFLLKDCLPNVPENLDFYFTKSDSILIKTAPLLDITAGLSELQNVKAIHIIALDNEVKELLWELEKEYKGSVSINTVNLVKHKTDYFSFTLVENTENPNYNNPQKYLYEPNSAIMKSGGFNEVSLSFKIDKLHKHTHLYTSNALVPFPGRVFEILQCISYNKADMKIFLDHKKMNITTRNFPETVENIRKKWKIKEGGDHYSFFTTDQNNNKIVLICKKIPSK